MDGHRRYQVEAKHRHQGKHDPNPEYFPSHLSYSINLLHFALT
jgi:hypothetical protein